MPTPISNTEPELWAITAYFNPERYARRTTNYRTFSRHLPVPLLTVELSFDDRFELHEDEASILVRLTCRDIMWQKERLLNVALAALPSSCRKIVWVDSDVLINCDNWPEQVSRALDRHALVQPFSRHDSLRKDGAWPTDSRQIDFSRPSLASAVHSGVAPEDCLARTIGRVRGGCTTGIAWAGRRELLTNHGFYDRCVVGGGDRAIAAAAYGCFDEAINALGMNPRQREHYLAWAHSFHRAVRSDVGFVECVVAHLWHGEMADRQYVERHHALAKFDYDPQTDVRLHESGALCWNSEKPALHQYLRAYFRARKEDGRSEDG